MVTFRKQTMASKIKTSKTTLRIQRPVIESPFMTAKISQCNSNFSVTN